MGKNDSQIPTIAIIGAGFSGICLAANLYQMAESPLRIIIIGSPMTFGKGIAYSTTNLTHLLNVRSKDMSVFSENADHFVNWILSRDLISEINSGSTEIKESFVPRYYYGLYLQDILHSLLTPSASGCRVDLIQDQALSLHESEKNFSITLLNGTQIKADKAVLTHGHLLPKIHFSFDKSIPLIENPWDYQRYLEIPKDSDVLITGTGLTMIDAVIQLKSQGHAGKIYALSRRGLIPQIHLQDRVQYAFEENISTLNLRELIKFIRREIKKYPDDMFTQQAIFKALRLKVNSIWISFTMREKKQFLRHCQPYWETQRHRIPPEISHLINELIQKESLTVIKGRIKKIKNGTAIIQQRKKTELTTVAIQSVINCIGPGNYATDHKNPLIESLIAQGLAVLNDLNLGLKISPSGALINKSNRSSNKLYTLGPPSKGILYECTATKEIRLQSLELAKLLTA